MKPFDEFLEQAGPNPPAFTTFPLRDVNPLGHTEKTRIISAPNPEMAVVHGRLIHWLRGLHVNLSSATGARPSCSPLRNAMQHRHHRYFYLTDIHSAYDNVNGEALSHILASFVAPEYTQLSLFSSPEQEAIFCFLKEHCLSRKEGLLTGAPASPDLFNLYCAVRLDSTLRELAKKYGATYTRYLDDLTFSSDEPIGWRKRRAFNMVVREAGFTLSDRKTRVLDKEKHPVEINGVGIRPDGQLFLPRGYARLVRRMLHAALPMPSLYLERVSGMMGVYLSITRLANPKTKIEREIASLYHEFRRRYLREKNRSNNH